MAQGHNIGVVDSHNIMRTVITNKSIENSASLSQFIVVLGFSPSPQELMELLTYEGNEHHRNDIMNVKRMYR
jgi:hypothetical protein